MKEKRIELKLNQLIKIIAPLIVFIIIMIAFMVMFGQSLNDLLHKPESIKNYIEGQGVYGFLVYIALQILQIIVAVIPGEPIQLAGGYIYGTFLGSALSTIGIMIGSLIVLLISRKFGLSFSKLFVKEEKLLYYKEKMESRKGLAVLFILFLIPGLPKDVFMYAAGLTPIRFRILFGIYFVARLPAIVMASYMGAQLGMNNILGFAVMGAFAIFVLSLAYFFRDQLYKLLKI